MLVAAARWFIQNGTFPQGEVWQDADGKQWMRLGLLYQKDKTFQEMSILDFYETLYSESSIFAFHGELPDSDSDSSVYELVWVSTCS
jgi:hypothetical protein